MKTKRSSPRSETNLPVSKQTAGGVTGAVVGSALAGPLGAVVGAVAGTIMGNRAAKGKTLVSAGTVRTAKKAAKVVGNKVSTLKKSRTSRLVARPKKVTTKARSNKAPAARKATKATSKRK